MAKITRRVPTTGANHFVVSELNPNESCGGLCACGSKPHDQQGPYIVFAGEIVQNGKRVRPVVCTPCAKAAVIHVEQGGEVAVVGAGSAADLEFDGGQPTASADYQGLKKRYESEMAGRELRDMPTLHEWLKSNGHDVYGDATGGLSKTGVDPNATSLVQARADTSPVGVRGGPIYGRTDDPAAQLANPDNWGTPEGLAETTEPDELEVGVPERG